MDPLSAADGASKLLQDLSTKFAQGANILRQVNAIAARFLADNSSTISHSSPLSTVRANLPYIRTKDGIYSCSHARFQMKSLDNDILASLAMLRRHINSLQSPICRLPNDVIPEIASHLRPEADLIHLSHVSYRLRSALLSQPSLWSYVDVKHEDRAQAFFARSKQVPLRVNLVKDDADRRRLSPLYSRRERIVSLEMCNCAAQKQSVFSQPMPALRRLEIVGNDHEDHENYDEESYWQGTKDETSWSLPSVTTFVVHGITSIPLRFPHLTRFKFREGEETTTIDELLDFLDNCPLLEDIDISHAGESSSSRNQLVSLPNLRTYTQSMFDAYCALRLFDMLSLPPSCSVTTTCRVSESSNIRPGEIIPSFQNPDYLAGITRLKLRTTHTSTDGITGALELINSKGTKVCSERAVFSRKSLWYSKQATEDGIHNSLNLAHLRCLQGLDARSAEILCLQGCKLWDGEGQAVDTVKYALGYLRGISTLILSGTAVKPCLLALDMDPAASGYLQRSPPVQTLIIHSDFKNTGWDGILRTLLTVAQRRKVAGSPFRIVSLFLLKGPESKEVLEALEECIERFEVTVGDNVLEWDVDKYFLDGLDHLRERRDVRWD
jgi:hypothetical protein